jgi:predicted RNase H-like nuclease
MTVMGIDGCRGGWLVVRLDQDHDGIACSWHPLTGIVDVLRDPTADAVAVDIPIGLPANGDRRACDRLARARIPGRASSVFPAPPRAVLGLPSYAAARGALTAAGGPSMSAQAWGIVPAVRAVDAAVSSADDGRIVEAHPEVAFAELAAVTGAVPPLPAKTSAAGRAERTALILAWQPDVAAIIEETDLPVVDLLDALACAWVAHRWLTGRADVLTDRRRDARGLPMRIVC